MLTSRSLRTRGASCPEPLFQQRRQLKLQLCSAKRSYEIQYRGRTQDVARHPRQKHALRRLDRHIQQRTYYAKEHSIVDALSLSLLDRVADVQQQHVRGFADAYVDSASRRSAEP